MMIIFGPQGQKPGQGPKNPLTQILMAIIWLVVLVLAFMFSLVFFAVVVVVGLGYWLYFWWKTRALREALRQQMQNASTQTGAPFQHQHHDPESIIIEGEAIRVLDEEDGKDGENGGTSPRR